jgi:hypothetical protein
MRTVPGFEKPRTLEKNAAADAVIKVDPQMDAPDAELFYQLSWQLLWPTAIQIRQGEQRKYHK